MLTYESIKELGMVAFGIESPEEIIQRSVVEVTSMKLTGANSVYDERLGPLENGTVCKTCGQTNKDCVGHFGHIMLNIDIINPLYNKLVINILKCICYKCSRLLMTEDQLRLAGLLKTQKHTRFSQLLDRMDKIEHCSYCEIMQPKYVFSSHDKHIYMVFKFDNDQTRIQMTETEIRKIFENMSDITINLMGFDKKFFHPRNLIMTSLPVLPPVARPFVVAENLTCDDDLTVQYLEIVKVNNNLKNPNITETKRQKCIHTLKFRIKSLFDNSGDKQKLNNGRPLKGIKKRLTGKEGIIRNNLMGKRVDKSARTVIGPDPTLRTDEIAVPPHVARILCVPEHVNDINIDKLQKMVDEGNANFLLRDDGNIRINIKYATVKQGTKLFFGDWLHKRGHKPILIQTDKDLFCLDKDDYIVRDGEVMKNIIPNTKKHITLKVGDIVERPLKNGDILLLNRQPTLHKGSMIAMKVCIIPGNTIRLNLAITQTFNADFDGDEMNVHCPASPETEAELRHLSAVQSCLISNSSSRANIVIVQDTAIAVYLMTNYDKIIHRSYIYDIVCVLIDKCNFHLSEFNRKYEKNCKIRGKKIMDGKFLFSLILPDEFHFRRKNDLRADEPTIVITDGILVSGCINKSILNSGHHSIIRLLHKEFGDDICMRFIDGIQFIGNAFLTHVGFSVGIRDCRVVNKNDIEASVMKSFMKARSIEENTNDVKIREVYVQHALNSARDTGMKIAKDAMDQDNNFLKCVKSGAKGDYFNIAQITGLLGQQNLCGQRITPTLNGKKRTLPHFPINEEEYDDEMRYVSHGFIRSSFTKGLSPREFFFHAMTGREGITDTAMKTATSGYIQRRMIKIAEDIQIKYDGTVRNSSNSIIQFCYGDHNMDPSQMLIKNDREMPCDIERIVARINYNYENSQLANTL